MEKKERRRKEEGKKKGKKKKRRRKEGFWEYIHHKLQLQQNHKQIMPTEKKNGIQHKPTIDIYSFS